MATSDVKVGACPSDGEPSEEAQISGRPENFSSNIDTSFKSWKTVRILWSRRCTQVHAAIASNGSRCAVKVVQLSLSYFDHDIFEVENRRSELFNEISILECIEHKNIVDYWGCKKTENVICIFYELFDRGFSIRSLIEHEIFEDSKIPYYTRQILKALEYLHENNIVQRNLRCQNVLVNEAGTIKLTGFKFADKLLEDNSTSPKGIGIVESSYWIAPEIAKPEEWPYGTTADIWYLGCTVLEMTTRNFPFPHLSWLHAFYAVLDGETPPIPESVSGEARDFIERCLQQNPADRPTASELLKHPFLCCFSD